MLRRKFYLCLILILCVKVAKSDTLDSLLLVLDKNITSCKIYSDKKDIRIRTLKEKLHLNQLSNETTYHLQELHIPADTRSAFPVISVQSPVSIQCCWQS